MDEKHSNSVTSITPQNEFGNQPARPRYRFKNLASAAVGAALMLNSGHAQVPPVYKTPVLIPHPSDSGFEHESMGLNKEIGIALSTATVMNLETGEKDTLPVLNIDLDTLWKQGVQPDQLRKLRVGIRSRTENPETGEYDELAEWEFSSNPKIESLSAPDNLDHILNKQTHTQNSQTEGSLKLLIIQAENEGKVFDAVDKDGIPYSTKYKGVNKTNTVYLNENANMYHDLAIDVDASVVSVNPLDIFRTSEGGAEVYPINANSSGITTYARYGYFSTVNIEPDDLNVMRIAGHG